MKVHITAADPGQQMASTVLYRLLQAPTAVSAACCISTPEGHVVLQLQDTRLTCWRASSDGLEQTASWRAPASMLQMVHLPGNYLLLLAEGGQCYLHSWQEQHAAVGAAAPPLVAHAQLQVPIDSSASHVQPYGCVVSRNALSAPVGQAVASLVAVAYMPGVLHVIKASPFVANNSNTQGASSSAAAASTPAAGAMSLQVKAMALTHTLLSCHYPGDEPPALASVRVSCRVLDMAWLSPAEQQLDIQGRSLLAVLHEMTVGSQPPVRHVDCVAVNWAEETISPGPWSLRNVHPTTQLLQPFAGSEHLPPGILAISSRGVQLCTCLGSKLQQQQQEQQQLDSNPHAAAAGSSSAQPASAAEAGPSSHVLAKGLCVKLAEVVQWGLAGLPLSCAPLSDSCYLVGDSRAGLYLFKLGQGSSKPAAAWVRLQPSSCLTVPDVLLHAPLVQQQQQQQHSMDADLEQHGQQQLSGLLLVGGKCSSSQVLGLTQAVADAAASIPCPSKQRQFVLPVLQSALQPSIAGAQAVALYQDPTGALPEQQLLVACGIAPRGKLAVVRSGCGLMPAMLDGPELPGDAELFAITQPHPCQHKQQPKQQSHLQQQQCPEQHSMLGFSFPSAGASSVMSLEGQTFRQLQLTGLSHEEASLLMTTAPGGWLVQVTSSGVRVLEASADWQLCSQWAPTGGSISLAAAHGSRLVVACGAQLTVLTISCCSGTVAVTATAELQQQASAVSMFTLQGGQLMVAAGLWVDNTTLLMTCPAQPPSSTTAQEPHQQQQGPSQLQVACSVDLQADQPRSIAVLPVDAADVLLVGSNTGKVLLWQICSSTQQGQGAAQQQQRVSLQHAKAVQISNTSVSLQQAWLPDVQPGAQYNSSSTSTAAGQRPVVRCVVAHAGAMAVFRPNTALLAAVQQDTNISAAEPSAASAAGVTGLGPVTATACVAVSRLCGSEACLGAAPVHTSDMPFSLAWVSNTQRLCFGSIEAEHKLRWRSCGLLGTPLAVAVHQRSDTIVLLLAADEYTAAEQGYQIDSSSGDPVQQRKQQQYAQQRLVVLDGRSLQVLMSLTLAPGHIYTTLQVLDLPATSQKQQHTGPASDPGSQRATSSTGGSEAAAGRSDSRHAGGQQQQQQQRGVEQRQETAGSAPGCLPFIVLGSHVVLATADSGPSASTSAAAGEVPLPRVKRLGVLSFFELKKSVVQAAAAATGQPAVGSELRYELVLHGMVPLQVTPSSACTVVPELLEHTKRQQAGSEQAAADAHAAAGDGGSSRVSEPGKRAAVAVAKEMPLLVVGSERGLTLLRVVVDDLELAERQQLEAQLMQIGKVPDGSAAVYASAMMAMRAAATAPPATEQSMQSSTARRCGRVTLQELSSTVPMNQGVVTKLSSSGSCVVALESLGSVTAFRALCVQPGGWVPLMSVANAGMESGKLIASDFAMQPAAVLNLACADAGRTSAAGGARESAGARPAGVSSSTAAPQQEPQAAPAAAVAPQNQAILVAAHPAGLMLLQRDLQDEGRHVSSLMQAAQAAWEAGNRPDEPMTRRMSILMAEPVARAQPWQGAGEAAPWAGLDDAQQQRLQGLREEIEQLAMPAAMQGQARQVLAAEAAAAAGVFVHMGDVRPDWLAFVNVRPGLAPAMIPSASCAPAPGSMLLCQVRLGLHPVAASASEGGEGVPGDGSSTSRLDNTCSAASTILCLSGSGGVATAQLLAPEQGRLLLDWQQHAVLDSAAARQLMKWGTQDAAGERHAGNSLAASGVAESNLRGLLAPDAVASYEGYDRAPGALAHCMAGKLVLRTGQGPPAGVQGLEQGQQEGNARPFGVVDGDLLFMGAQMGDGSEGMGVAGGLQHRLWQDVL